MIVVAVLQGCQLRASEIAARREHSYVFNFPALKRIVNFLVSTRATLTHRLRRVNNSILYNVCDPNVVGSLSALLKV